MPFEEYFERETGIRSTSELLGMVCQQIRLPLKLYEKIQAVSPWSGYLVISAEAAFGGLRIRHVPQGPRNARSRQQIFDNFRTERRQRNRPHASIVFSFRINAEGFVNRREEVTLSDIVFLDVDAVLIGRSINEAAFESASAVLQLRT